jgi:cytochrome c oxidase assembly protein subunit 15
MAFPDWPTSDGYNMLFYPWLQSSGDRFLEHGHRLAGMLIGIFSIGLVALVWKYERRLWVTVASSVILLSVVLQGLLGGLRVLENDPRLAMIHGLFAAMVFALMAAVALFTSRSWMDSASREMPRDPNFAKPWAVAAVVAIVAQYSLGGMLRHLGTAVFEHMGMAVIVLTSAIALVVAACRTKQSWISRPAWGLLLLTIAQISLGLVTFVTKFGLKSAGWVAVSGTTLQSLTRSSHTIIGMLLLMASVIVALRVFRMSHLWNERHSRPATGLNRETVRAMKVEGGLS